MENGGGRITVGSSTGIQFILSVLSTLQFNTNV